MSISILKNRCLIKISGDDAADFLQNIITGDINSVTESDMIYSCLLTPQGAFLHDFFISKTEGGFFVECERGLKDDLLKRLKIFKLRSKVEIEDLFDEYNVYASDNTYDDAPCFIDPRLPEMGYRFYSKDILAEDEKEYQDRRIDLGVPDVAYDIDISKDVLANVNLDLLNSVSFDKGCYIGQEVTNRIKNKGKVKRRLLIVTGKDLKIGRALYNKDHDQLGVITSVNSLKNKGLSVLKLDEIPDKLIVYSDGKTELSVLFPNYIK